MAKAFPNIYTDVVQNLAGRSLSTKLGKVEEALKSEESQTPPSGTIMNYMNSAKITEKQKANIEWLLFRMFICCALPWALLNSEFFVAFVFALAPAFVVPDRSAFFPKHLAQEVAAWGEAFKAYLEDKHHLTLSFDGWSTKARDELYTFHTTTPRRRSFFTHGHVFKGVSVTGEALLGVILKVYILRVQLHLQHAEMC